VRWRVVEARSAAVGFRLWRRKRAQGFDLRCIVRLARGATKDLRGVLFRTVTTKKRATTSRCFQIDTITAKPSDRRTRETSYSHFSIKSRVSSMLSQIDSSSAVRSASSGSSPPPRKLRRAARVRQACPRANPSARRACTDGGVAARRLGGAQRRATCQPMSHFPQSSKLTCP